jgi:hypothetical protein
LFGLGVAVLIVIVMMEFELDGWGCWYLLQGSAMNVMDLGVVLVYFFLVMYL